MMKSFFAAAAALLVLSSCAPSEADIERTRGFPVEVFFNDPGTRRANMWEPDAIDIMVETINGAQDSIDFSVMGFNRDEIIDALIAAYDRGIEVRMVGDAGHLYNSGYTRFRDRQIPMSVGNDNHIMHNKFMVVDNRFTFGGTSNWTDTDLRHNSNNFFLIDSPPIAELFTEQFEQMFNGLYGHTKAQESGVREFVVGDTVVEVWFAPAEDTVGRILELVNDAEESVRFTIFAFTKDTVGSTFIRKQEEFLARDEAEGVDLSIDFRDRRSVAGVIDKSQLHSNGQYHEAFRLLGAQIPMREDGNDNGLQPGDYQAGGGRLHSKTMVLDQAGENPVTITGSFNWSASATQSNDEFLIIFRGARIAKEFDDYFEELWEDGKDLGREWIGKDDLQEGDVVINEVMWYGLTEQDENGYDQFIELRNMTDKPVVLDMWQIENPSDFVVGIVPGSVIPPNGLFTILDHTMEPYSDGVPQNETSAFKNGSMTVNAFNDDRQARLYLKDGYMDLRLLDPKGNVVDRAGDGGPPFAGGLRTVNGGSVNFSMERRADPGDGTLADSWYTCTLEEGGENVNEPFKSVMVGTPAEENSEE